MSTKRTTGNWEKNWGDKRGAKQKSGGGMVHPGPPRIATDDEQKRWAFAYATGNSNRLRLCRFAGYRVDSRTVRKQVYRVESRMEYYWELRSKDAQNIKALMCPLY